MINANAPANPTSMEKRCMEALKELDIEFIFHSSHNNLRSGTNELLFFDFVIPTTDESYFMIECKGIQHYKLCKHIPISLQRKRSFQDSIKEDYCSMNQYPLLVIKYDEIQSYKDLIQEFIHSHNIQLP
jgi:hypothetical protein